MQLLRLGQPPADRLFREFEIELLVLSHIALSPLVPWLLGAIGFFVFIKAVAFPSRHDRILNSGYIVFGTIVWGAIILGLVIPWLSLIRDLA